MIALKAQGWLFAAVLLIDLSASAQPAPAAPTALRMRFVAGQRSPYVTTTTQTMSGPAGRMNIQTRVEIETLRVNPDGSAARRMRVMGVEARGENIPASVRRGLARALAGVAMEYTQDQRGQVSAAHATGEVTVDTRPVVESLTQQLDQMSTQLPENPVRIGESWTTRRSVRLSPNAGGSIQMQYEIINTLRELHPPGQTAPAPPAAPTVAMRVGPVAVIDVQIRLSTPAGSNVSGVPVTGDGRASGTMTLDLGRAVLVHSSAAGTLQLRLDVAGRLVTVDTRFENDTRAE